MTAVAALLRFAGRLLIGIAYELEEAWDERHGVPNVIPEWMQEEADL